MKIIYNEGLSSYNVELLNSNPLIYKNTDGSYYLMADCTYNKIKDEIEFGDINEEWFGCVYNDLKEFVNMEYEQKYYTLFDEEFAYYRYNDELVELISQNVNEDTGEITFIKSDNWMNDLELYVKKIISKQIAQRLLNEIFANNLDMAVFKDVLC